MDVGAAIWLMAQIHGVELHLTPRNFQDGVRIGDTLFLTGEVTASAGGGGYGGNNVALLRLHPDGTAVWDTTYGTNYDDGGVAIDRMGDTLVVAGYLRSANNTVNYEVFVGLFSPQNGQAYAIRQFGKNGYDVATDVHVRPDRTVWISWLSTDPAGQLDGCWGKMDDTLGLLASWCYQGKDQASNDVRDVLNAITWTAQDTGMVVGTTEEDTARIFLAVLAPDGTPARAHTVYFYCQTGCPNGGVGGISGPVEARDVQAAQDTFVIVGNFLDTLGNPPFQGIFLMTYRSSMLLFKKWRVTPGNGIFGDTLEARTVLLSGDTAFILGSVMRQGQEDAFAMAVNWRDGNLYWALAWGGSGRDVFRGGVGISRSVWAVGTVNTDSIIPDYSRHTRREASSRGVRSLTTTPGTPAQDTGSRERRIPGGRRNTSQASFAFPRNMHRPSQGLGSREGSSPKRKAKSCTSRTTSASARSRESGAWVLRTDDEGGDTRNRGTTRTCTQAYTTAPTRVSTIRARYPRN